MDGGLLLWQHQFIARDGKVKTLAIRQGDMCSLENEYDILVCSAFKGDYVPTYSSLIGSLYWNKNISVGKLAERPEIDLRAMGCWLSRETGTNFRRIACVELLSRYSRRDMECRNEIMLKSAFSTLRFLLEQADIRGIPLRSVALPVLGTGNQGIELYYIVGPLLNQCLQALENIDGLEEITFYERNPEKAAETAQVLRKTLEGRLSQAPQVFISYRSTDADFAYRMCGAVKGQGYACWMAPESIPAGGDYMDEIAVALRQVSVVALLLTPQAESSRWVSKEIGVAVGNGCTVLPYQPYEYPIGEKFRFLLEGIQIIPGWKFGTPEDGLHHLMAQVHRTLH